MRPHNRRIREGGEKVIQVRQIERTLQYPQWSLYSVSLRPAKSAVATFCDIQYKCLLLPVEETLSRRRPSKESQGISKPQRMVHSSGKSYSIRWMLWILSDATYLKENVNSSLSASYLFLRSTSRAGSDSLSIVGVKAICSQHLGSWMYGCYIE